MERNMKMSSARSARKSKSEASATHYVPLRLPHPPLQRLLTPPTWVSPLLSYDLKRKIVAVAADDCLLLLLLLLTIVAAVDCCC